MSIAASAIPFSAVKHVQIRPRNKLPEPTSRRRRDSEDIQKKTYNSRLYITSPDQQSVYAVSSYLYITIGRNPLNASHAVMDA